MENKEFQEFMVEQFSKLFTEFQYLKVNIAERFEHIDEQFDRIAERSERIDEQFDRIAERFERIDGQFDRIDDRFDHVDEQFDRVDERFDLVEEQIAKLGALDHGDIEKVARQVEQLVLGQESLQDDMDYLLRRALRKKSDRI